MAEYYDLDGFSRNSPVLQVDGLNSFFIKDSSPQYLLFIVPLLKFRYNSLTRPLIEIVLH